MDFSTFIIHFLYIAGTFALGFLVGNFFANKTKANLEEKQTKEVQI